jgi:hypothetical protein
MAWKDAETSASSRSPSSRTVATVPRTIPGRYGWPNGSPVPRVPRASRGTPQYPRFGFYGLEDIGREQSPRGLAERVTGAPSPLRAFLGSLPTGDSAKRRPSASTWCKVKRKRQRGGTRDFAWPSPRIADVVGGMRAGAAVAVVGLAGCLAPTADGEASATIDAREATPEAELATVAYDEPDEDTGEAQEGATRTQLACRAACAMSQTTLCLRANMICRTATAVTVGIGAIPCSVAIPLFCVAGAAFGVYCQARCG